MSSMGFDQLHRRQRRLANAVIIHRDVEGELRGNVNVYRHHMALQHCVTRRSPERFHRLIVACVSVLRARYTFSFAPQVEHAAHETQVPLDLYGAI